MAERFDRTSLFPRKRPCRRRYQRRPGGQRPSPLEQLERRCLLAADLGTAESSIFWQGETVAAQSDSWIVRTEAGQPTVLAHLPDWQLTPLGTGFYGLHAPGASSTDVVGWAASTTGVAYVEPDYAISSSAVPNDPSFSRLWGLTNTGQSGGTAGADIDAATAWDTTTGSDDVVIAVIDSGVDYTHPDLAGNIWTNPGEIAGNGIDDDGNGYVDDIHGYDFYADDADPMDDDGHGTHVAGTIGAVGNNGIGISGVAWDVSIMALRFLGPGGGFTSDAIRAVNYATAMREAGVNVVATNNSWGGGGFSQGLSDAIAAGYDAGVLFVAAAGNDGTNNDVLPHYPSNDTGSGVISVAATTRTNSLASFSNYGVNSVDLAAPGASIYSTTPGNSYDTYSGTSMAAPHVSGVIALMAAANPAATPAQLRTALLESVTPLGSLTGRVATGGLLDAAAAVAAITGATPPDDTDPVEPPADDPPVTGVGEPNDAISEATPLSFTLGEAEVEAFIGDGAYLAADVDLYSLFLTAGTTVTFDIDARTLSGSSPLDSYIRLFDVNGVEVAANDDDGTSFDSQLSYTAGSGTYFLGVSAYGNSGYDPNTAGTGSIAESMGRYTLRASLTEPAEPPADDPPASGAGEPNDSIATATVLTFTAGEAELDAVIGDGVHETADVDLYSLDLAAGETVTIDIDAATLTEPSSLDSYLRLFDAAGSEVASNDDGDGSFDSLLTFTAESAGSYIVGVSGYGNASYDPLTAGSGTTAGSLGAYTIRVDRTETEPPETGTDEPNDVLANATPVTLTYEYDPEFFRESAVAEFEAVIGDGDQTNADVDLYSIDLLAGDTIWIDVDAFTLPTPSTLNSYVRLFDPEGVEWNFNDDDGESMDSAMSATVYTAGTYFIGVSSATNSSYDPSNTDTNRFSGSTGDYKIRIETTWNAVPGELLEPNDSIGDCGILTLQYGARSFQGMLGDNGLTSEDVDLFGVSLLAGETLTVDIDANSVDYYNGTGFYVSDSYLRLFSNDGTEVAFNDDDGTFLGGHTVYDSLLTYTAETAGIYYIGISAWYGRDYDPLIAGSAPQRLADTGDYPLYQATITVTADAPPPSTGPGEPNDTLANARPVTLVLGEAEFDAVIGDGLFGESDVDLYSIDLDEGTTLTVDVDVQNLATTSALDSFLRLFDASGNELASNDDDGSSFDSLLTFNATTAGRYFVGLTGYGNNAYDPSVSGSGSPASTGHYILRFTAAAAESEDPPGESDEPNDVLSDATLVTVASGVQTVASGSIGDGSYGDADVDLYRLDLDANTHLTVDLDARSLEAPSRLDSYLRIFDASGAELMANDDDEASFDSFASYTTTVAGTYYVGISSFGNEFYDPAVAGLGINRSFGDYQLVFTASLETTSPEPPPSEPPPPPVDEGDEPNDSIGTAATLALSGGKATVLGLIGDGDHGLADVDLYAVSLGGGDRIRIDVDARTLEETSFLDSYLRLFDSFGNEVAENDDDGDTLDSELDVTVDQAGTYYIGVSAYGNSSYDPFEAGSGSEGRSAEGSYELSIRVETESLEAVILPVDPEERTEPIESLTIIFTQPVTGFDKGDLQLTRDGTPVSLDGKPLTSTDGIVWTISGLRAATAALGEYELVLNATGSGITTATGELLSDSADISWEVVDATVDEPGSTIDKAERVASDAGPVRLVGRIGDGDDRRRDVDLYAVQLAAGQMLTVDVDAESLADGSTLDSFLRLFDSSGRELTQNDDAELFGDEVVPSLDSLLTHTAQLPGTYYVGVSGYGNSRYEIIDDDGARRGSVGDYEVSFTFGVISEPGGDINRVLGIRETIDRGGLSVVDQAFAGYEVAGGVGPFRPQNSQQSIS